MIKGGYILQPRSFDKSEASHLPPVTRELWFYILRNVNHSKRLGFERGQGFFSLGHIQEALCWYSGFRKNTYSKPQLTKSLRRLCERNMVATTKATRGIVITVCNYDEYQTASNYEGNGEGTTEETRRKSKGHTINKNDEECKNEEEPKPIVVKHDVEEVVNLLNSTTGSKYRATTKATSSIITARINEGFTVDDLKTVIIKKSKEWLGTDMAQYLRPSTLFAPKNFEGYLNQPDQQQQQSKNDGSNVFQDYKCV